MRSTLRQAVDVLEQFWPLEHSTDREVHADILVEGPAGAPRLERLASFRRRLTRLTQWGISSVVVGRSGSSDGGRNLAARVVRAAATPIGIAIVVAAVAHVEVARHVVRRHDGRFCADDTDGAREQGDADQAYVQQWKLTAGRSKCCIELGVSVDSTSRPFWKGCFTWRCVCVTSDNGTDTDG